MESLMSYERDLAFNLRLRGIAEQQIEEAVHEVHTHTAATGVTPESEFGTPEEYAKTFEKGTRRTRGVRVVIVAAVLALAYVAGVFALKALADFDIRTITGPTILWPALVILGTGIIAGFLIDYLRPAPTVSKR